MQGGLKMLSIRSNRHELFPLVLIRYTGSRFAWDLENIASRVHVEWVENVVDSTRFHWINTNRFPLVSIHYPWNRFAQDLKNITSRVHAGWDENVADSTRFNRIDTNRFLWCRFVTPEVDLHETYKLLLPCIVQGVWKRCNSFRFDRIDRNRLPF